MLLRVQRWMYAEPVGMHTTHQRDIFRNWWVNHIEFGTTMDLYQTLFSTEAITSSRCHL